MAATLIAVLSVIEQVQATPCPSSHPEPLTTVYEVGTFTALTVHPWVRTGGPCILGNGFSVWQRAVDWNVSVELQNHSYCFSDCWDRFWARSACCRVSTAGPGAPVSDSRTETVVTLSCSPPGATPPAGFTETINSYNLHGRVDPPNLEGTALGAGRALRFPMLPGGEVAFASILTSLADGFDDSGGLFQALAAQLSSECSVPQNSSYVSDFQNVGSNFTQIASGLATGTAIPADFNALASALTSMRSDLALLSVARITAALPHLDGCVQAVDQAAAQAAAGLDTDGERVAFLGAAQDIGSSMTAFGESLSEPAPDSQPSAVPHAPGLVLVVMIGLAVVGAIALRRGAGVARR